MLSDRAANVIIGVVTTVWTLNMAAALIPALSYEPDATIHGIFTLIVGGAFAARAKDRTGGGGDHRR